MKVIGIISSPNLNGNTASLVREVLRGATLENIEITEVYLPKYKIEFCTGCSRCMAEGRCHVQDDFESLKELIYQADGIVWSSPTYGGSQSAMIKRFIERLGMYERFTSSLGGKYMIGISTCSSMGAKKVAKDLILPVSSGIFKRGYITGTLGVSSRGKNIAENRAYLKKALEMGRKIAQDIKKGKKYRLQNFFSRIINNLIFKPMFKNAIIRFKEDRMKAVYQNLIHRRLIC